MMSKMMKDILEKPLEQCGAQECDRRVGSVGQELKKCSRQVTPQPSTSLEF